MKYLILLFGFLLVSCGSGTSNTGQNSAENGTEQVSIAVDRTAVPWDQNNSAVAPIDGYIDTPVSFIVDTLSNPLSGGGWVDIRVENKDGSREVLCYQRTSNTTTFVFKYKKLAGVLSGCDSNSDKDPQQVFPTLSCKKDSVIRVIPREAKLQGKVVVFTLNIISKED